MPLRVILLEPEKEGNIGGAARSMKNFDQNDLWIVNPKTSITMEARAYSMHGYDVLSSAKIVKELDEALTSIDVIAGTTSVVATSRSNLARVPISPREFSERLKQISGNVAIIFGRESSGLNNDEIEKCDLIVTIPASRVYNVLNLSSAVSIILYEIFQKSRLATVDRLIPTNLAKERLLTQFDELVSLSETQAHKRKLVQRAFRNLTSRSFISMRETSLLIGVFRRINLKINDRKKT